MDTFNSLHKEIVDINTDLLTLLKKAKSIPEMPKETFDDWEKTCRSIEKQVSEEIVRVAVVGAIKSGKSTFSNSLFEGDYLKRGAGVVTSIVTRVRHGEKLEAQLYFKSWDEVNEDIRQALALLPSTEWHSERSQFDLRDEEDRRNLEETLRALGQDALNTDGFRNANSVLLASYLGGYEKVKTIVSSETFVRRFDETRFSEHLEFVSQDALAVYLHDVQLEINTGHIMPDVEIADCQGSDSPNPLHLAMIQDYLLFTHLIIYVISSRTGLRQADIRFLSIIKKMGLIDQIFFVVNCDFSEHDTLADLRVLIGRVKEEISLVKSDPDVHAFSSLYSLFKAQEGQLTPKDKMRLAQWESEAEFISFSKQGIEGFLSSFQQKLTGERYSLLVNNHIERLGILSSGLNHWAQVNRDILMSDTDSANEIVGKITHHQEKMTQIDDVIRSALDGAAHRIKEELKGDIERFFRKGSGSVLNDTAAFIHHYDGLSRQYEVSLEASGFSKTLYLAYEEFKAAVDRFIAEEVNPEVIRFVKEKEEGIGTYLQSIASQYDVIIKDTLAAYDQAMGTFGMTRIMDTSEKMVFQDIEAIRIDKDLKLPISVAAMRYSTKIRTEATLHLGAYNALKLLKRIFKRPVSEGPIEEMRALKTGLTRMKHETQASIASHFMDQKENIKFQYFFRLVDAAADSCHQMLLDRFQIYTSNLTQLAEKISENEIDRGRACNILHGVARASMELSEHIGGIKETARKEL